jgi:uncharacterized RmlC-like cupin family protein
VSLEFSWPKTLSNSFICCLKKSISEVRSKLERLKMADDGVKLVKPGMKYEGAQGVTYDAGVSRNTVGAEKVCMNILPMPPGVKSKPHIHRGIETIAYMLEGECTLFHGEQLENQTLIKQGEQIFIPENVPHAPYNLSDKKCIWIVVHSSGDDQDELVRTTELDYILENFGG